MPEIVVFAIDDALASSIALPLEMLRAARQHHVAHTRRGRSLRISLVSEQGAPVRMSGALTLLADTAAATVERAELVIIPSLWRAPVNSVDRHPGISASLARLAESGARLCAVGTGSYFLAAAGLLDDRPATTHWSFFDDFAARFPKVRLQRRHLITHSGSFYCAGSVNSVADLMLHFIRELFSAADAHQVESQFSPEIRRPFEPHGIVEGAAGAHPDELMWVAQDWMLARLDEPLRMAQIAAHVGLSARSFSRRFGSAFGVSPHGFLQRARLNLARDLLRQSNLSISEIGHRCGYSELSRFSRAFTTHVGSSPQDYRRRARGKLFGASGSG
ncbi:MAG: helix-turn-helix domain-containing protein [Pseudomonadales bacterium]|jgi:transcriptional regulator GlxA family with amidase domain|nr:helix-turn-helix domain-containing protein [Gammaproteobacteria bacterium]MBP6051218.1 helix-turn-helix domain-containing protein [Pseudomonadales bacterium]MBK7170416.1 helix-turn-helix domain-containing protein [Gammaproteobacteria bacterium]MBK7522325.1 helix-turn-helix domain-containing protein [Gammaproteobacteria bacterium]MBK9664257.1 helix-turn-helix domain-containing protein [Gammaproteobacteria bacterium]